MDATETDGRPRYRAADLRAFTRAVLEFFGLAAADARLGAEVLIDADLHGIDSHGIAHLASHRAYVPGLREGVVNPRPAVRVLRETASTAAWDGGGGFGLVVAHQAMSACIAKAEASGIGMVTVRNGRHFGAAGYFARMASERDFIGMAMCNVPPIAPAAGGLERVVGTNPLAFSAPVEDGPPFLLDIATTAVSAGKLEIARRQGKRIPQGWAVDADGADSDDPEITRQGGSLLPLGSHVETGSHKGYGLGLMVDVLAGLMSGVGAGLWLADAGTLEMGQWFAAWRIDAFREPAEFKREMRTLAERIRRGPPMAGVDAVMLPGDQEAAAWRQREAQGVPLDPTTVEQLQDLGAAVGTAFPGPMP